MAPPCSILRPSSQRRRFRLRRSHYSARFPTKVPRMRRRADSLNWMRRKAPAGFSGTRKISLIRSLKVRLECLERRRKIKLVDFSGKRLRRRRVCLVRRLHLMAKPHCLAQMSPSKSHQKTKIRHLPSVVLICRISARRRRRSSQLALPQCSDRLEPNRICRQSKPLIKRITRRYF